MPAYTLAELAARTGATLDGEGATEIRDVAPLDAAEPGTIAFLAQRKYRAQLDATRASAVIVASGDAAATALPKLVAGNPYAVYAKIAALLRPEVAPDAGVHATAVIDPTAQVAGDATIGAHAVVGRGARIGERAVVGPGCVVGDEARIGDDVRLVASVTVYARSVIGPRTVVHAGAVIGSDGFGLAEEAGHWIRIPQLGRAIVGADCDIGANTTIDRGALGDTVIEDDVKLDNQIQVAHNCRIGAHTAIAGCVGIAGSAHIGRRCRIGGAAMIAGHLEIADDTVISAGTLVSHSIATPGVYTSVFPVLPNADWKHVAAQLRNLRELASRVRELERSARAAERD